jgi:hypothetical protein
MHDTENLRSALMMFIMTQRFEYFITLTIGGGPPAENAKKMVGHWAQLADHWVLGRSYQRAPAFRFHFIGFPEMTSGHFHYHLGASAPQPASRLLPQAEFDFIAWSAWTVACPTGKFHMRTADNQLEMARYMTKQIHRPETERGVILSADFHPQKTGAPLPGLNNGRLGGCEPSARLGTRPS